MFHNFCVQTSWNQISFFYMFFFYFGESTFLELLYSLVDFTTISPIRIVKLMVLLRIRVKIWLLYSIWVVKLHLVQVGGSRSRSWKIYRKQWVIVRVRNHLSMVVWQKTTEVRLPCKCESSATKNKTLWHIILKVNEMKKSIYYFW